MVLVTFYGRLSVITAVLSGSSSVWLVIEVLFVTTLLVLLGNGLFHSGRECESVVGYGCIIQCFRATIFLNVCIKACECRKIYWQLCASEVSDTEQLVNYTMQSKEFSLIPRSVIFSGLYCTEVVVQCTYMLQYC